MILVVTDTNVFIDLMSVDALEAFFALGLEVHTTGFVTNELNKEQSALVLPHVGRGRLVVDRFTEDDIRGIDAMRTRNRLHFTDRSVVRLAEKLTAMVLSGDGRLWKECQARRLDVHGTIWVMEHIWMKRLIQPVSCIQRLNDLKKINSRLPKDKIDALIERIRKG
jgi:predicted nucleic acid-binding protein